MSDCDVTQMEELMAREQTLGDCIKADALKILNDCGESIGHGEEVITESSFKAVAEKLANRLEAIVRQGVPQPVQTAGQLEHNLEWYIPEGYNIAKEPSILNVFDEENNIIDNELFMLTTLIKK
jgi:hypothetical protein